MTHHNLLLVTEDLLSERLGQILLSYISPGSSFSNSIGKRGIGYIQGKLKNLNEAARGMKIVVLVDRDGPQNCPINLIHKWIGGERNKNLIVRFAEMEIESWIMADSENFAKFLDVLPNRIADNPDSLFDPKREIVNIARRSRNRRIREDICPPERAKSLVGPGYNSSLENFLINYWRPDAAITKSMSLTRAVNSLENLLEM